MLEAARDLILGQAPERRRAARAARSIRGREQIVERIDADRAEHRFDIGFGMRCVHLKALSSLRALMRSIFRSHCAERRLLFSPASLSFTLKSQPAP